MTPKATGVPSLVPSAVALADSEVAPEGTPDPKNRITILLGAGASRFAGAPSTDDLTALAARRPISGKILADLRSRTPSTEPNFEDVLHVLEEVEFYHSVAPSRAHVATRPFVTLTDPLRSLLPDVLSARCERLALIEDIASAFNGINYDASWQPLYRLLRPFLDTHNIDIFTLNYDLVGDVSADALSLLSGKHWFDGFGRPIDMDLNCGFRSDEYAGWDKTPLYITLAHIHGSLRFAYRIDDTPMAYAEPIEIVSAQSIELARANWKDFHDVARDDESANFFGVSPIVSGLRKTEKLNVRPYANYYSGLAKAISGNPRLIVIGYGGGDEHINYWIRELNRIHPQHGRVIEITDQTDPINFMSQRIAAYDLRWDTASNPDLRFCHMGLPTLVYTKGLTADDKAIPTDLFLRLFTSPAELRSIVSADKASA
ncbi:MAG: hypothetical protein ABSE64_04165 [Vulcanimicrobiaceae bacterium]|jgi:hypothetical protein